MISLLVIATALRVAAARFEAIHFRSEEAAERAIVHAVRIEAPPALDGALDEAWWEDAMVAPQFHFGPRAAASPTSLRVAFDTQSLYLAALCGFSDIDALQRDVPAEVHDGNVWGDDCIDFKLSPDGGGTILQFLANANGARQDTRNGAGQWDGEWSCAAVLGEDAYALEMAIPLSTLGIEELQPGTALLFTCGRNDRANGQLTTAFGEKYGDVTGAAKLILGTAEQHAALLSTLPRDANAALYLDRDRYPTFQPLATGRVRIVAGDTGPETQGDPAVELALLRGGEEIQARTVQPVTARVLDFDWRLQGLEPGVYEMQVRLRDDGGVFASATEEFVVEDHSVQRSGRIPLTVTPAPAEQQAWPITVGVPFPWGALDSEENVRLLDESGNEVPVQVKTIGRWSKRGSIRWLQLDFMPPVGGESREYTLQFGPDVRRAEVPGPLEAERTDDAIALRTGPLQLVTPRDGSAGIGRVWLDGDGDGQFANGEMALDADETTGPFMVNEAGERFLGIRDDRAEAVLEEAGPLRACVRISGWHVSEEGERLGRYIVRIHASRGLPWLRVEHTFIITADSDEARYRGIGHHLPFRGYQYVLGTPDVSGGRVRELGAWLLQRDDLFFRVYEEGAFKEEGEKAEGWLTAGAPGRFMTLAVRDFWQQFPKELEVSPEGVTVHFWPEHAEEPIRTGQNLSIRNVYQQWFAHEGPVLDFTVPEEVLEYVKQDSETYNYPNAKVANAIGLAKTHEMLLYFHARDWESAGSRQLNEVFQEAPAAVVEPEWVCASEVFGRLHPRDEERFPRIEGALEDAIDCIMRHRITDRDYGMFNYGDSHHNWDWQGRRWNLHRIWRNTHHGWTRWPWLMYARTGDKRLLDWADANARHVADVDHCHYTTEDLEDLSYPLQKLVGGICDYKGFVHWASGGRLGYNSVADSMLWHYYVTGSKRSLTTALEHGTALLEDGKPRPHREGAARATSAAALYFLTWDNDYLEFLERTVDTLLDTQREDGSFPQWENFAPYLQRYVDLTGSRRAMAATARWADWTASQPRPPGGYHAKINILAHAYLYTGDDTCMQAAAYQVSDFVDHVYRGADPRYYGQFIVHHSNLDQSYFMQEVPYYLSAAAKRGGEAEPAPPTQTSIRCLSRETVDGQERYVLHARISQERDEPLALDVAVSGYAGASYEAVLEPLGGGPPVRASGTPEQDGRGVVLHLEVPAEGATEYALRVLCGRNFFVTVPISKGQPDLREAYPIFAEGTWVGDGFPYFFDLPEGTEAFTLTYKGRSWPLEVEVLDPSGEVVSRDVWIGSNDLSPRSQRVSVDGRPREGWSFRVFGYGQACILGFEAAPVAEGHELLFAPGTDKLLTAG
ncbi:MAG: hypothetical protein U9R79_19990 [Armatimonadota bacterium]|nr:hypothetical protein [Armatimonadota bacterium]